MNEYLKQANDFAEKTGTKLEVLSRRVGRAEGWQDKSDRFIYRLRLSREGRKAYEFEFFQSIAKYEAWRRADGFKQHKALKDAEPTMYDVLACLTTYDPGDFFDFCSEFGYEGTRDALKLHIAVKEEYEAVLRLFGDVLEELAEIQ